MQQEIIIRSWFLIPLKSHNSAIFVKLFAYVSNFPKISNLWLCGVLVLEVESSRTPPLVRAASKISSEWLSISDKPGKIA